jgi:hypothetical protein
MVSGSILTESGRNKSLKEGSLTKAIEQRTSQIPSSVFLALAGGAIALSFGLAVSQKRNSTWANFVGQWAPTILLLGIYNKIVKTHGSDRVESRSILH